MIKLETKQEILRVDGLRVAFRTEKRELICVDDVSFSIRSGENVALVGESGCGKSVTALSVMHLLAHNGSIKEGTVVFDGEDITRASEPRMEQLRGDRISMIFQEPMTSLNPLLRVDYQITEVLRLHKTNSKAENRRIAAKLLAEVGIPNPEKTLRSYPHELSGGMRQRVMIAMALACDPALLIADEPTTALDVTIQAQILELLKQLHKTYGISVLLITHDLGVVAELADRVVVMYCGQVVESASVYELFSHHLHPYTEGLLAAVPRMDMDRSVEIVPIPGTVPSLSEVRDDQCRFANRCAYATERCLTQAPPLTEVSEDHFVRCHRSAAKGCRHE